MEMGSVHSEREKWIMHYSSSHKILLVGEGDFSFAACLGRTFGSASNIVATSLDSREKLLRNYSKAGDHLQQLEDLGCTIIHGVDANTMSRHPLLEHKLFDKIVFNFPHAGLKRKSREWQARQIKLHRKLMRGFFGNAGDMLVEDGEVHVTHKTSHPYTSWKIEELAEDNGGLYLVDEANFSMSH